MVGVYNEALSSKDIGSTGPNGLSLTVPAVTKAFARSFCISCQSTERTTDSGDRLTALFSSEFPCCFWRLAVGEIADGLQLPDEPGSSDKGGVAWGDVERIQVERLGTN